MTPLFRKVYLEISNICNLQCTFCPVVERDKKVMSLDEIDKALQQIKPYAERVCFHVMGEPLNHPQWGEAIERAAQRGVPLEITTNGTLLTRDTFHQLMNPTVQQINFSLQSFVDNFPQADPKTYFHKVMEFVLRAEKLRSDLYINFRFWNLEDQASENPVNEFFLQTIEDVFGVTLNRRVDPSFRKSKNIRQRIYAHFDSRFEWPHPNGTLLTTEGTCWGARAQLAIHADGRVVPCCLDKEAAIELGSLKTHSLSEILQGERFLKIRRGFENNRIVEDLCQKCSYRTRFGSSKNLEAL